MRAIIREMRRAPVRIATSIAAIALAIAAIGVFAVPGVAENSLRDIAAEDHRVRVGVVLLHQRVDQIVALQPVAVEDQAAAVAVG